MRSIILLALTLVGGAPAWADFSYTTATKMGAGGFGSTSKVYLKGQKVKYDYGTMATIIDFGAQTVTLLNSTRKTYTVTPFSQMGQGRAQVEDTKVDVKQTGLKKTINGYNASQTIMTIDTTVATRKDPAAKMHIEVELWVSQDVPGGQEMRVFYQKNADRFAAAMSRSGRGDASMEQAMGEVTKKMGGLNGVVVEQIMRMSGGQQAAAQEQMAQMQKQLEQMKKQGNLPPQVAERLGNLPTGGMSEIVQDSTGFSTNAIPAAEFAIPAGYQESKR